jgi:hypothetical protein
MSGGGNQKQGLAGMKDRPPGMPAIETARKNPATDRACALFLISAR